MATRPENALIVQSDSSIAHHRKLFRTEQGYSYQVVVAGER